jgi:hypothetical protein
MIFIYALFVIAGAILIIGGMGVLLGGPGTAIGLGAVLFVMGILGARERKREG